MEYCAVPINKYASTKSYFDRKAAENAKKLAEHIGPAAPFFIGAGVALGVPIAFNLVNGVANKTFGLHQFFAERSKHKQINKQIKILNTIAKNTKRPIVSKGSNNPQPSHVLIPVVPPYTPKRIQ